MRKLENEGIRELEKRVQAISLHQRREVVLEEWGCASEIKQILNKIKATPCKPAEGLSVYSTLPKVVAWRVINFGKVWDEKAMYWGY